MTQPRLTAIRIVAESGSLSAFVPALAKALSRRTGASVTIDIVESDSSRCTALATLLSLEAVVLRRGQPCWSDRIDPRSLDELRTSSTVATPDFVIDLTTTGATHASAAVLRPLYDGAPGENALASALFFRGTPDITISHALPGEGSRVIGNGIASLEAAAGTGGAMEAVWSRVVELLVKALSVPLARDPMVPASGDTPVRVITHPDVIRRSATMVASAAVRAAYRLCCHAPHWRVGWRRAGPGDDVWSRRDLGGVRWNVLPDPIDHFYADPFPFFHRGRDYIFFEDLDHKTGKGIISVVAFDDAGRPGKTVPVLEEPWHLSYPFLIETAGEIWMIPEASLSGEVGIYRAVDFPYRWERHGALLSGIEAADATIVRHGGLYHMFAVVRDGVGGYSDTLCLWHADDLFGPWQPHAENPVLIDDRTARPAGNFVVRDGVLMRPVQDCRNGYGAALALARVDNLDRDAFGQTIETHLAPDQYWPGRKLHILNGNGRLETIDGSIIRPKSRGLAALTERRYRP